MRFVLAFLIVQVLTLAPQAQAQTQDWSRLYARVDVGIQVFELLNEQAKSAAGDAQAMQDIALSIESFLKTGMWFSGESSDPMMLPDLETLQSRAHGWIAWEGTGKNQRVVRSSSPVSTWLDAKYMSEVMASFTAKYPRLNGVAPILADLIVENFCTFAARASRTSTPSTRQTLIGRGSRPKAD